MNEVFPEDICFNPETAKSIALDLYNETFNTPRTPRSPEYKTGFQAGAFNNLLSAQHTALTITPNHAVGTCQLDAWLAGYEEGRIATCSFKLQYSESLQETRSMIAMNDEDTASDNVETLISFT